MDVGSQDQNPKWSEEFKKSVWSKEAAAARGPQGRETIPVIPAKRMGAASQALGNRDGTAGSRAQGWGRRPGSSAWKLPEGPALESRPQRKGRRPADPDHI